MPNGAAPHNPHRIQRTGAAQEKLVVNSKEGALLGSHVDEARVVDKWGEMDQVLRRDRQPVVDGHRLLRLVVRAGRQVQRSVRSWNV